MAFRFSNQVVWITGASSGIGEALAYAYAREGAKLILSARNEEALRRVGQSCPTDAANIFLLPLDLRDGARINEKAAAALQQWGRIDYLIHNAGQASRGPALETDLAVDRAIMETNYFGPVALTKAVVPAMLLRGQGGIVVVSSLSGKFGAPKLSAYAASKHALHGFFASLRIELAQTGIRIIMIVPGFINTPIIRNALDSKGGIVGKNLEVNARGMSPENCAERMLRAIRKGKSEAYIGGPEIASVYLSRFFPGLFSRIMSHHPVRRLKRAFPLLFR